MCLVFSQPAPAISFLRKDVYEAHQVLSIHLAVGIDVGRLYAEAFHLFANDIGSHRLIVEQAGQPVAIHVAGYDGCGIGEEEVVGRIVHRTESIVVLTAVEQCPHIRAGHLALHIAAQERPGGRIAARILLRVVRRRQAIARECDLLTCIYIYIM